MKKQCLDIGVDRNQDIQNQKKMYETQHKSENQFKKNEDGKR